MSCPDWRSLVRRRDEDAEGELLWERALGHLDECEACREPAYAAEPTLVFRRLPALETTSQDVEAMQRAVGALRRAQPIVEPAAAKARRRTRRSPVRWMRAAAMVAVAAGAALVYGLLGTGGTHPIDTAVDGLPKAFFSEKAPRELHFEIQVLRASKHEIDGPALAVSDLPPKLADKLNEIIRYEHYEVLAEAGVDSAERAVTSAALGEGFEVSFKAGSVGDRQIQLADFTIERKAAVKGARAKSPLLSAPLDLELDQPFALIVGSLHQEDLLVLAVTCRSDDAP